MSGARAAALRALGLWRRDGAFSEDALERASAGLDAREAALCARLVHGTLQNLAYLDHYIGLFCDTPIKRLEPKLLDILRLSAYQLLFLDRVPPRAAVSEAVALCRASGLTRAAGLANAVLRRLAERRESLPELPGAGTAAYLALRWSHPLWLVEALVAAQGYAFTEGFLRANNETPPVYAQVNTLRTGVPAFQEALRAAGVEAEAGGVPGALRLRGAGRVSALPGYAEGHFYVQDEAARLAVEATGAAPGMTVLDACAAPGGKSFAAGIRMEGRGRIVACDLQARKLRRIEEGAARLGLGLIETRQMDARRPDAELMGLADVVIADAPCSGLGVIRKKPEIRYRPLEELAGLPQLQYDILRGLAGCVKPGGTLLYATCTVRREENEDVAARFLAERPDFAPDGMRTLWPHIHQTDGFFLCRMIRSI